MTTPESKTVTEAAEQFRDCRAYIIVGIQNDGSVQQAISGDQEDSVQLMGAMELVKGVIVRSFLG